MTDSPSTRPSLLVRIRDPQDKRAWAEFQEIYAPLVRRLAIQRRTLRHRPIHIRNSHQQTHAARRKFFDKFDLVQVARSVVVNRRPEQRAQIAGSRRGFGRGFLQRLHLRADFRGKVRCKPRVNHRLTRPRLKIKM